MLNDENPTPCSIRLRFIPFALKNVAKKWLYSLTAGSITSWDGFIKVFLKKFYPIHKIALVRKNIIQFKQESSESLWRYVEHFKDLLVQCPHHGIEKWRQCQILYDSLDYSTKSLLESMCQGGFLQKDENERLDLYENLVEKTIQWEPTSESSRNPNSISSKGGLHSIESSIAKWQS